MFVKQPTEEEQKISHEQIMQQNAFRHITSVTIM